MTDTPQERRQFSRILFDATDWGKAGRKGLPDGMKVDKDGNLGATGPGGVVVLDKNGTVVYAEQVKEVAEEPNYDASLSALKKLL